jgi:Spy/CpxP family protein refolding chaperone
MKANRIGNLAAALLFAASAAPAQTPEDRLEERREDIQAMKVGFLTQRLDLTPEEAQAFWPVYNDYQEERDKIKSAMRSARKAMRENPEDRSDAELAKMVDNEIAYKQQDLDLLKKYHSEFKRVLPIRKVAMLYGSEEEFKRELLKRLQEKNRAERPRPRR